ncbi:MAG: hypothetical protein RIS35_337 [Pseudomonadota bacterium]|jgi:hypothetical protein
MGIVTSGALASLTIGTLPRAMFLTPAPWIKLVYALSLTAAAAFLTARLARPPARLKAPVATIFFIVLVMLFTGVVSLGRAPVDARLTVLLGQTWWMCPWLLAGFSLPALGGTLWAVRGLAPTRPERAGLAFGLLAGCFGAAGDALACPESSPTFVAVWYTVGIGLTTALGRALGPTVLRW